MGGGDLQQKPSTMVDQGGYRPEQLVGAYGNNPFAQQLMAMIAAGQGQGGPSGQLGVGMPGQGVGGVVASGVPTGQPGGTVATGIVPPSLAAGSAAAAPSVNAANPVMQAIQQMAQSGKGGAHQSGFPTGSQSTPATAQASDRGGSREQTAGPGGGGSGVSGSFTADTGGRGQAA